jgi:hypothetical protein
MSWSLSVENVRRHSIAQGVAENSRELIDPRVRVQIDSAVSALEIMATTLAPEKPLRVSLSGHVGDDRRPEDKSSIHVSLNEM